MAEMVSGSGPLTRVITDPDTGLSMRFSVQSNVIGSGGVAFTETLVVDMLVGAKVLQPNGACRIEGIL
jgi:dihydroorotate dehydrogenase